MDISMIIAGAVLPVSAVGKMTAESGWYQYLIWY
jgi:hypothetical protein